MPRQIPQTSPSTSSSFCQPSIAEKWKWWIGPALVSLVLGIKYLDPFLGDWDALDYTVLALKGEPSSMILGRMLFVFFNSAIYQVAHVLTGLEPAHAYKLFKFAVLFESPFATIAWWALAFRLTSDLRSATAASLLLAFSPFYIVYSGQAMTEIPSILLLAIALLVHLHGLRSNSIARAIIASALLGACVNVREGAALYAPWLVFAPLVSGWRVDRRFLLFVGASCIVFMVVAFGPFVFWYWLDVNHYRAAWQHWAAYTKMESTRHPVSLANFKILLKYFFYAGPLVLVAFPVAAYREYHARRFTPLLLLALIGFLANLSLIVHYSVVLNGRYLLTGLPAMVPLVGAYFVRQQESVMTSSRRAFINVIYGISFIGFVMMILAWPVGEGYVRQRALAKDYNQILSRVPSDAVMIAGGQTVGVTYWRGIGAGEWEVIPSGGGWPGPSLAKTIDSYLQQGRRVFLDADPRWWYPCGWQALEIHELVNAGKGFRYRHVAQSLFEVLPPSDSTATDDPNLEGLLPEKRPAETRYCP